MNAERQFGDTFDATGTSHLYVAEEVRNREPMPLVLKIILAADVIFCLIRIPSVILSLLAARAQVQRGASPSLPLLLEFICGLGIVTVGTSGNLLLILRQAWATSLAYVAIGATIGSIIAGACIPAWGEPLSLDGGPGGRFVVAVILATAMRLITLGVYAKAVWGYSGWAQSLPSDNANGDP
jgi:hypothetical protein